MMDRVIVRDARNRPLRRLVVATDGRRVYVAAREAMNRVESGEISPIGFDKNDVFTDTYEDAAVVPAWDRLQHYTM